MASALVILPIILVQCVLKFLSILCKWVSNKIDKLFAHKNNEGKVASFFKDFGNFLIGFIPRVLQFSLNLVYQILELPKNFITNGVRIFQSANDNSYPDTLPYVEKFDNLDARVDMFCYHCTEKLNKKINPGHGDNGSSNRALSID